MSLLKKLFGGGSSSDQKSAKVAHSAVDYEGFTITPAPMAESGGFRIAAHIEMEGEDGTVRRHHLIRADVIRDMDEAVDASIEKAKLMIDQSGLRVFD